MFFDIHCHLTEINDTEKIVSNSEDYFCCSCLSIDDYHKAVELKKNNRNVLISCAVHPYYIDDSRISGLEWIKNNIDYIDAVGETGIDQSADCKTELNIQIEYFVKHIELAQSYHKPLIVHCRKSYYEIYKIIRQIQPHIKIAFHNFTGNAEIAAKLLEFKMAYFSYTSNLSKFNNSKKKAAQLIPLDRILFETDAPFLSNYSATTPNINFELLCTEISLLKRMARPQATTQIFNNATQFFFNE